MSGFKSQREIYQALIEGKRVRRNDWDPGEFVYLNEKGEVMGEDDIAEYHSFVNPPEWCLFIEPLQKKKLYKYAYKHQGIYMETVTFYPDSASALDHILTSFQADSVIRLDYTMIEVDQ